MSAALPPVIVTSYSVSYVTLLELVGVTIVIEFV